MIKIANLITLILFQNFATLPGIFALFSWDLPVASVVISEEEINDLNSEIDVKPSPKSITINYLLQYSVFSKVDSFSFMKDKFIVLSIYLNIFSPPPNFSI